MCLSKSDKHLLLNLHRLLPKSELAGMAAAHPQCPHDFEAENFTKAGLIDIILRETSPELDLPPIPVPSTIDGALSDQGNHFAVSIEHFISVNYILTRPNTDYHSLLV